MNGLDPLNRRIIDLLRADGRRSYVELAEELGVQQGTVRRRLDQLVADGVVHITTRLGPLHGHRALLGLRVNRDSSQLAAAVLDIPEVVRAAQGAGFFDWLLWVDYANDQDLLTIVEKRVRLLGCVTGVEIIMPLKVLKDLA
jgi:Lrp/AsnC family transcriptional regulator for asnA, asnC and gidA